MNLFFLNQWKLYKTSKIHITNKLDGKYIYLSPAKVKWCKSVINIGAKRNRNTEKIITCKNFFLNKEIEKYKIKESNKMIIIISE